MKKYEVEYFMFTDKSIEFQDMRINHRQFNNLRQALKFIKNFKTKGSFEEGDEMWTYRLYRIKRLYNNRLATIMKKQSKILKDYI